MPSSTSVFGHALAVEGALLQMDNGASPDAFVTIANVSDVSIPIVADTIDVTNIGDDWHARIATLHDMGKMTFTLHYQPEDPTHSSAAGGGSVPSGLMYNLVHNQLRNFQLIFYNVTAGANVATWAWSAYVTGFQVTGKVGGDWQAKLELVSNGTAPSLS